MAEPLRLTPDLILQIWRKAAAAEIGLRVVYQTKLTLMTVVNEFYHVRAEAKDPALAELSITPLKDELFIYRKPTDLAHGPELP